MKQAPVGIAFFLLLISFFGACAYHQLPHEEKLREYGFYRYQVVGKNGRYKLKIIEDWSQYRPYCSWLSMRTWDTPEKADAWAKAAKADCERIWREREEREQDENNRHKREWPVVLGD